MIGTSDPHSGQPVLHAGAELPGAWAGMVMIHGRGASAGDIIALASAFERPDVAYLAPEASGNTWYPHPFMSPVERNEPGRRSALGVIAGLVAFFGDHGIPPERVAVLGFSQGACLALEFAARNPRRYGAIAGLTGGLIGATVSADDYAGSLAGTPVFIGSSDIDPHIPLARVKETSAIFSALGAEVVERIYPGMAHTINEDEVGAVKALIDRMTE